jgi:four helix bundle protein
MMERMRDRGMERTQTNKVRIIRRHTELEVYRQAFDVAMRIFEISKTFPSNERYSLTDQIRRSSRSVCANMAEAWRKRRYEAAFISKLGDSEAEAAETQTWIDFALKCGYVKDVVAIDLSNQYDNIIGKLVRMITFSKEWVL